MQHLLFLNKNGLSLLKIKQWLDRNQNSHKAREKIPNWRPHKMFSLIGFPCDALSQNQSDATLAPLGILKYPRWRAIWWSKHFVRAPFSVKVKSLSDIPTKTIVTYTNLVFFRYQKRRSSCVWSLSYHFFRGNMLQKIYWKTEYKTYLIPPSNGDVYVTCGIPSTVEKLEVPSLPIW